ncbi:MAG: tetratricopeptide repeat protein [Planctomycetota bacterium]|nr:tetratricopeptide repeat protein [Planctomycetaceae bacterium]MDQ3330892.1 tetratricopeptide repeat protein [Planctomycetota bacterium]
MSYEENLAAARRHVRHGRYDEAIELFQRLLTENDIDPALHDAIGSAYFLAGRNEEAAKHFERIIRLTTNPGKALINLGAVYNRIGEHQKAVDSIRKGIQYEKRSVEGYYNLGVGHRKLGQHAMAVTAYKEALRLDPKFAEAHQNLGNVYLDQGLPEQAAAHYRKALELRPDLERAARGLADAERAAALAKQAVSPFGRLVDTQSGQHAGDDGLRPLTNEEREIDRRRLHDLSKDIEAAAGEWLTTLHQDLEAALATLEKRIAVGRIDGALLEASDNFSAAITAAEASRRQLRRKVLELVAHEELQHSPG